MTPIVSLDAILMLRGGGGGGKGEIITRLRVCKLLSPKFGLHSVAKLILVVLHVVLKLVNVTEHSSHYATIIHIISNHIVWLTDSGMPRSRQRQRMVHVQCTVITRQ